MSTTSPTWKGSAPAAMVITDDMSKEYQKEVNRVNAMTPEERERELLSFLYNSPTSKKTHSTTTTPTTTTTTSTSTTTTTKIPRFDTLQKELQNVDMDQLMVELETLFHREKNKKIAQYFDDLTKKQPSQRNSNNNAIVDKTSSTIHSPIVIRFPSPSVSSSSKSPTGVPNKPFQDQFKSNDEGQQHQSPQKISPTSSSSPSIIPNTPPLNSSTTTTTNNSPPLRSTKPIDLTFSQINKLSNDELRKINIEELERKKSIIVERLTKEIVDADIVIEKRRLLDSEQSSDVQHPSASNIEERKKTTPTTNVLDNEKEKEKEKEREEVIDMDTTIDVEITDNTKKRKFSTTPSTTNENKTARKRSGRRLPTFTQDTSSSSPVSPSDDVNNNNNHSSSSDTPIPFPNSTSSPSPAPTPMATSTSTPTTTTAYTNNNTDTLSSTFGISPTSDQVTESDREISLKMIENHFLNTVESSIVSKENIREACIQLEMKAYHESKTQTEYIDQISTLYEQLRKSLSYSLNPADPVSTPHPPPPTSTTQPQPEPTSKPTPTSSTINNISSSEGIDSILSNLRKQTDNMVMLDHDTIKLIPVTRSGAIKKPTSLVTKFSFIVDSVKSKSLIIELRKDYDDPAWVAIRKEAQTSPNASVTITNKRIFKKYYDMIKNPRELDHFLFLSLSFITGCSFDYIYNEFWNLHNKKPLPLPLEELREVTTLTGSSGGELDKAKLLTLRKHLSNLVTSKINDITFKREESSDDSDDSDDDDHQTSTTSTTTTTKKTNKKVKPILWKDDDIARGNLTFPLAASNSIDNSGLNLDGFTWIGKSFHHETVTTLINNNNIKDFSSPCQCVGDCHSPANKNKCKCLVDAPAGAYYNEDGQLMMDYVHNKSIYECTDLCKCSKECKNKVIQVGNSYVLELFKTKKKGWGVRSTSDIPANAFVCEYVGEIVSNSEAEIRGKKYDKKKASYLFDLDVPTMPGEEYFCIDGTHYGNESRFLNHSCNPNLENFMVHDTADYRLPRIAFFSNKFIPKGEELTFNYGYVIPGDKVKGTKSAKRRATSDVDIPCHCKSSNCRQWLWRAG